MSFTNRAATMVCAVLVLASAATNASARPDNSLLTDIAVSGSTLNLDTSATGTFTGTATITGMSFNVTSFILEGNLNGTVSGDAATTQVQNQPFSTTGTLTLVRTGRNVTGVTLDLSPALLEFLNLEVDLQPVTLDVSALHGTARNLGNLLIQLVRMVDNRGRDDSGILFQIFRINSILETALKNLETTGTVTESTRTCTFSGIVTLTGFTFHTPDEPDTGDLVTTHGLTVSGTINGFIVCSGTTSTVLNETFEATAKLTRLSNGNVVVETGPIELSDGVVLQLRPILIHLDEMGGSRTLIGNLFVQLINLINRHARDSQIQQAVARLNDQFN